VFKRVCFMTVINGVCCLERACYKQTRDSFQSSLVTLYWNEIIYGRL